MIFSAGKKRIYAAAVYCLSAGLGLSLPGAAAAQTQAQAQVPPQEQAAAAKPAVKPVGKVDEAALLRPSALKDMGEGEENAPITLIEYASLSCGHCADFYLNTVPSLRAKYIKTGKVHYIMRELGGEPRGLAASMLTRCVPEDKFFPFVQLLFEKQEEWAFSPDGKTPLTRYAKMAGLSDAQFNACLTNEKMFDAMRNSTEQSIKDFNIRVTPTLFINGEQYEGALSMAELSPILDKILAAQMPEKR